MIIERNLSNDEINQALEFYASEAGRKYTLLGLAKYRNSMTRNEDMALPSITEKERKKILEFGETSAGQKIFKEKFLTSEKTLSRVKPLLKAVFDKCIP